MLFPHPGQVRSIFVPHSKQNLEPSGISFWHSGHIMSLSSFLENFSGKKSLYKFLQGPYGERIKLITP
jgi:hypothetical protein